MKTGHTEALGR